MLCAENQKYSADLKMSLPSHTHTRAHCKHVQSKRTGTIRGFGTVTQGRKLHLDRIERERVMVGVGERTLGIMGCREA